MKSKYRPKEDDQRMSAPRPYDLDDHAEVRRLIGELRSYMRVSLADGTDSAGRAYAHAALVALDGGPGIMRLARTLSTIPVYGSEE